MVIVVTEKHPKQLFYLNKIPFRSLKLVKLLLFEEMLVLTSVTIIKQVFLRKLICYESLMDIEVSKH